MPILVTGAAGTIGGKVAAALTAANADVRRAVRRPTSPEDVRFDFTDAATFPAALDGVERVLLVRPPQLSKAATFEPFLAAAADAGVTQIVFLSLQGADRNKVVPHAGIEKRVRASGIGAVFLRASFFMENLTTTHAADIRDRDVIAVPAGRGATSFVAGDDIAAVAARALLDGTVDAAWTLTGPQALTYDEVASVLTDVLGRPIRYRAPSLPRFVTAQRRAGHPSGMAVVMAGIYTTARLGLAGTVTDDVARLLGRPATTFEEFAAAHRHIWTP